jgi:capsular polysaccharide biosynthesis protein
LYRFALIAYPKSYRSRFAHEMEQVFREQWREVRGRGSSLETYGFLFWTAGELLLTSCREQIANLRKRPLMKRPSTSFTRLSWSLAGGAAVTAAILALVIGVTLALPKTYMSTARVSLHGIEVMTKPADASAVQNELDLIKSIEMLSRAAQRANLAERLSPIYLRGHGTLQLNEIVVMLHNALEVRPIRNTALAEIRVYDRDREMAADVANAIASGYAELQVGSPESSRQRGQVVDTAEPGLKPIRPNVPLNVFLGLVVGGLLGLGTAGVLWRFLRKSSKNRPTSPSVATSPA